MTEYEFQSTTSTVHSHFTINTSASLHVTDKYNIQPYLKTSNEIISAIAYVFC